MPTFDKNTGEQIQDVPDLTQPAPLVKDDILSIIREYNKSSGFTDRKLTDTPTDALAVVNRKYVTANGTTANRPPNPTKGQFYLDTSLGANGIPIWYGPNGWANSAGTLV